MKYKVGDTVMVRSDLNTNGLYGKYYLDDSMAQFAGRKCIVVAICRNYYQLKCNDTIYSFFTDEMLEDVVEQLTITKAKVLEAIDKYPESSGVLETLFPEVKKRKYTIGQRFRHEDGDEYILARIGSGLVNLINLIDGNRWSEHIQVGDTCFIAEQELNKLNSHFFETFKLIES